MHISLLKFVSLILTMASLYWGILSAGKISHDFVNALNDTSGPAAAHNKVVAVAAAQLDRAKTFAEKHGIPTVYGTYEELAANENINIVYVGNLISQHFDCCKMLLEAGKHVLCEKSLTSSSVQSKELYEIAKGKDLFLMEAVWSNFFPTYKAIKRHIDEGNIGEVKHVEASFGLDVQLVPRLSRRDLGGGASLDLGVYTVNFMRLVFGRETPLEIIAKGDLYPSGVDASWDAIIVFSNNRRAVLKCSSTYKLNNSARVTGTKGFIEISDPFHCPTAVHFSHGDDFSFELPDKAANSYNFMNSAGLSYEAAAVCEAVKAGKLSCEEYTPEDSLYIARVLDEIQKQCGVTHFV